jgi:hypothetical protein
MIEKILNLEELKLKEISNLRNKDFQKIYENLKKIGFFSDKNEEKSDLYCQKVFTILRREPNPNDGVNGQSYIRESFIENNKYIKSKIYDFDLKIISTCWADN